MFNQLLNMGLEVSGSSGVADAITSGLTTVKTDVLGIFAGIIGIALGIFAFKFAATQGVAFFSRLGKKA